MATPGLKKITDFLIGGQKPFGLNASAVGESSQEAPAGKSNTQDVIDKLVEKIASQVYRSRPAAIGTGIGSAGADKIEEMKQAGERTSMWEDLSKMAKQTGRDQFDKSELMEWRENQPKGITQEDLGALDSQMGTWTDPNSEEGKIVQQGIDDKNRNDFMANLLARLTTQRFQPQGKPKGRY